MRETNTFEEYNETVTNTIFPFSGEWNAINAAHLLRRTMYGANLTQRRSVITMGMEAAVDMLLADILPAEPPMNFNDEDDPNSAIGTTWVNSGRGSNISNNKRRQSIRGWTIGRALSGELHIREKMTLFWHNHFVVADTGNALAQYNYIDLLRSNCLGNFKQLTKDIVIDASMLDYLNGDENTKQAPNENFARELLELFTIGKGPLIAPGDYTHYTELDIKEMARVLTGWRDVGYATTEFNDIHGAFRANRHDTGSKQLSDKFGNVIINNQGENEYKALIDIIFLQSEVSRFMVRNIYRWFVHSAISPTVEQEVIAPLAEVFRNNNYEIKPVLVALFTSDHFYSEEIIGCSIKNPLDFVVSTINMFDTAVSTDLKKQYRVWTNIYKFVSLGQLTYFYHPSVAGWKAYYQSPGYDKVWLSSATLPLRQQYTDLLSVGYKIMGDFFGIDVLGFAGAIEQANDINILITAYEELLFPKPLSQDQKLQMKIIVLGGLPDFEWTIEYGQYLEDPDNDAKRIAIENKLRLLTLSMLRLPEFQLM